MSKEKDKIIKKHLAEELGDETESGSQREFIEVIVNDVQNSFDVMDNTLPDVEDNVSTLIDNLYQMTKVELAGIISIFQNVREPSLCETYRVDIFEAASKAFNKKG